MLLYRITTVDFQRLNSTKLNVWMKFASKKYRLHLKNIVCKWHGELDKDQLISFNKD